MFNVKFCSIFESDSTNEESSTTAISCPHYNIYRRKNGTATITTYKSMAAVDGVERHIMSDKQAETSSRQHYNSCYIENSAGKTVECIKP